MEFGFFIKKFISFFIEPFGSFLALFAIGIYFLFVKKDTLAKSFLILASAILLLYSYPPFANFLVKNLEDQYSKYDYTQDVKYIHVLGNGHTVDASQPISSKITDAGTKRVLEGVIIHKTIAGSKIIFTGYEGSTNISTAKMNAALAMALGVKEENIIINGEPKDTKEEALFAKSIVKDEPFVLVTSATHMPRSMKLFNSLDLNPIAAPTNFEKDNFKGYMRTPNIHSFFISSKAVHEYLGILWSLIRS